MWNISIDSYKYYNTREKVYENVCSNLNYPGLTINDIKN